MKINIIRYIKLCIKKPSHQTVKGRSKNCKIVVMPYAKTSSGG
jgi:hypothetical protein